ncbi:hypothetical protein CAMSH0001_1238 [Campylobacter showae RM3277]|uniref:Uncharacterized protein n=1 Tax=Campylobacter showae RM3277 TaxID=553219 RepID=C6RDS9_9BACT|nr:hypothetical protein CAMSH0001_1238 [Campylobacter showae RM3277]
MPTGRVRAKFLKFSLQRRQICRPSLTRIVKKVKAVASK